MPSLLSLGRPAADGAGQRFEDEINILRLGLAAAQTRGGRVTSLIGQAPGAGTTTLAGWLARSLARDTPTLLADGNFVHPQVHELFQTELEPGAVDLLEGRAEANVAVRPTPDPNLSVLPCGRCTASAVSPSVDHWHTMWTGLASDRVVLIDAGSANSPSALTVAAASDRVILVVKCGEANRQQIQSIRERMSLSGITLFGVILNQRRYFVPPMVYRRL